VKRVSTASSSNPVMDEADNRSDTWSVAIRWCRGLIRLADDDSRNPWLTGRVNFDERTISRNECCWFKPRHHVLGRVIRLDTDLQSLDHPSRYKAQDIFAKTATGYFGSADPEKLRAGS